MPTTPWSSTLSATTAPAPRAASRAPSTKTCSSTACPSPGRTTSPTSTNSAARSAFNHFPGAWARAMDTPFQWTKQVASHLGGTRNPMVVSWPARIRDGGGVRSQFHHVIDIAPTIYEAVGMPPPDVSTASPSGRSRACFMVYTFDNARCRDAAAASTSRCSSTAASITMAGWAASRTGIPWESDTKPIDPDTATWELYHLDEDFAQANDLAAEYPGKLRQLQDRWWSEASRKQRPAARRPQGRAPQRRAPGTPVADR